MEIKRKKSHDILISHYVNGVKETDKYAADVHPALMGIFGEVGSLVSAAKKYKREGQAFSDYGFSLVEEMGDAIWYFVAVCNRLEVNAEKLIKTSVGDIKNGGLLAASDRAESPVVEVFNIDGRGDFDDLLLSLAKSVSLLLSIPDHGDAEESLESYIKCYFKVMVASGISFYDVLDYNLKKTKGRFLRADERRLPSFDSSFEEDERIPDEFEIEIVERSCGKICMKWNGVFIGDPLTDNIKDEDGYRYHDVFHFAHAAILHWSPTFRALIKHKRKSKPDIDEQQDGGRAGVVEEGLTAWVFSRAKNLNFFEGLDSLSFDLLKGVSHFVAGYEVEACPLNLWERAILDGYHVFRQVKKNNGGIVRCSRKNRTIEYVEHN
ncbi:MAG: hypothetical protein CL538_10400 [Alcanivorax sp.]|nr:hypothetical protein [Alcanivorax sp.]MEA3260775.1 hypothetical protein [Pseudomonadota bacterium]